MAQHPALWPRKQDECSNMVDDTIPPIRRDFYVYVFFRPTGTPVYVGKGRGNRWKRHIQNDCHNRQLDRLIRKYGPNIPFIKVREGLTDCEAKETEIAFIAAIGRSKHGGPLFNATDGGDGCRGVAASEKSIASLIARNKSRVWTEDARQKHREATIAQFSDKDSAEVHKKATRLASRNPAFRQKKSKSATERWSSADERDAQSVRIKEAHSKPGADERLSAAARKHSIESRERQRTSVKAYWAARKQREVVEKQASIDFGLTQQAA